jgi:hypothetical protein
MKTGKKVSRAQRAKLAHEWGLHGKAVVIMLARKGLNVAEILAVLEIARAEIIRIAVQIQNEDNEK